MSTRFPQLPVMGKVPKKRKQDLSKTLTLEQAYKILEDFWMEGAFMDDFIYGNILDKFKAVAK